MVTLGTCPIVVIVIVVIFLPWSSILLLIARLAGALALGRRRRILLWRYFGCCRCRLLAGGVAASAVVTGTKKRVSSLDLGLSLQVSILAEMQMKLLTRLFGRSRAQKHWPIVVGCCVVCSLKSC